MRITPAVQAAFIDEMEKMASGEEFVKESRALVPTIEKPRYALESLAALIASTPEPRVPKALPKEKKAFMANVGNAIRSSAKWVGRHASGTVENLGRTITQAAHPLEGVKKGLQWTVNDAMKGKGLERVMGVGMGIVAPAVQTAYGVKNLAKSKEEAGGQGRGERLGRLIGGTAGGFIGAPHGITGGMAGGIGGEYVAGKIGKGVDSVIDRIRGRRQAPPPAEAGAAPQASYG